MQWAALKILVLCQCSLATTTTQTQTLTTSTVTVTVSATSSVTISQTSTTMATTTLSLPNYDVVGCDFETDTCGWVDKNQAWMRTAAAQNGMGPSDVFDGSYFLHLNVHLRPGATIALQGWAHGRFLRMNTSIIDASIPTDWIGFDWTWERFTVVDAGNGKIALHNTFHNRFVLMSSTGMDTSGFRAADELPSDAIWERFTVVDAGDGSIALHSGVHSRFVSLSDDGIVGVSEERNASDLPSAIERFRVVQVKPYLEPGSVVALYCTFWNRFLRMNDQADMDSAPSADSLPDPESWELFTVVDAGDGKIALHNAVHNRFATWLWGFLVQLH
ncbi:unnamed protein product [Symbiodinium sp. CCMP2592]|nr:unnamed protein product [Symbiodinium sp. CCMP2592]